MERFPWLIAGALASTAIIGAELTSLNHQALQPVRFKTSELRFALNSLVGVSDAPSGAPVYAPSFPEIYPQVTAISAKASTAAWPKKRLNNEAKVTIAGLGPIHVGMTLAEASKAAEVSFIPLGGSASGSCRYFQPQEGPEGIGFMVVNGQIIRIDIWPGSSITTLSGAGIDSTEAEIEALYPGQIEVSSHKYTDGQYLTFIPEDVGAKLYRLVFETDAEGRVTQYRAGQFPAVTWVEGCT
ncbi:MAG: hypothetical protein QNJ46_00270 [Leptolyngbyaceae cyanobacterium MO_188.B28]|nr:hypothetical protein [Leptolyngbyaceae cyanobacterium MO_188.B28]